MNWLHKEEEVTEEIIPNGAVGFIYMITHIPTGKYYIGKKSLESVRNVKIGVRELKKLKEERKAAGIGGRAPLKKKVRKSSDWEKYYSSNEWINEQVKEGKADEFKREIIEFCYSKKSLSYYEVYYQFKYNVLSNENSINENILGKFFKKDTLNTPTL
jgi:hypothetical protein